MEVNLTLFQQVLSSRDRAAALTELVDVVNSRKKRLRLQWRGPADEAVMRGHMYEVHMKMYQETIQQ